MFDFDKRLSRQLHAGAERIDTAHGDVGSVMKRGRKRQRRFQTAVAGTAFLAGAGLVVGLLTVRTHPTPHQTVELGPGTTTGSPAPLSADLSWKTAPATSGLATATSLSNGAGAMYAVSTAPGVSTSGIEQPALYRSTDGATWTQLTAASDNGSSPSIAGVFAGSDALYTVATGPASVRVSTSTNKGATFKGVDLPLDLSGPGTAVQSQGMSSQVAAGSGGVVVAVAPSLSLDLPAVVPSAASAAGWAATASGIEILGSEKPNACGAGQQTSSQLKGGAVAHPETPGLTPAQAAQVQAKESAARASGASNTTVITGSSGSTGSTGPNQVSSVPCFATSGNNNGPVRYVPVDQAYTVTAHYTWAQLGISPQAALALQAQPLLFQSTDGSHFTQVSIPAVQGYGMQLVYGPEGYALVTDSSVILSADGRTWSQQIELPSSASGVFGAGYLNGRLTVLASANSADGTYTNAAFVLNGTTWTTTPLAIDLGPGSVSFGPLGVAVVGSGLTKGSASSPWEVAFSRDGTHWSTESLNTLSHGPVVGAVAAVGPSTVVVTVTRPPANPAVPSVSAQLALIGTPTS